MIFQLKQFRLQIGNEKLRVFLIWNRALINIILIFGWLPIIERFKIALLLLIILMFAFISINKIWWNQCVELRRFCNKLIRFFISAACEFIKITIFIFWIFNVLLKVFFHYRFSPRRFLLPIDILRYITLSLILIKLLIFLNTIAFSPY